uniref:Uncharacterized protein n=1 Tax=uncultured marine microorganism HF4000_APKG8C21 TaxID=455553 RepID=B3TA24_9ZZZZ|nr:hypothetical protein ALOHA_HF4000APKG8C21ctg1g21 [uncultured marine microorganism HF4000_APKG8C21]
MPVGPRPSRRGGPGYSGEVRGVHATVVVTAASPLYSVDQSGPTPGTEVLGFYILGAAAATVMSAGDPSTSSTSARQSINIYRGCQCLLMR